MSLVEQLAEHLEEQLVVDTAADRIVRAVVYALEQYRSDLNADPFLEAVRLEVRMYATGDTPRRGFEPGDVRSVVVQHQSELKLPR